MNPLAEPPPIADAAAPAEPEAVRATPEAAPPPANALSRARRAEAALAIAASLIALVYWLRLPSQLPSRDDWEAISRDIAARATPGDAVLLDPHWAERARLFVPATPVLNLGRSPAREDLAGYRRILLLSLPDLPRSDLAAAIQRLEAFRFRKVEGPIRRGALALTVLENAQVEAPSFDFTGQIAQAKVFIRRSDGAEEICPLVNGRHPCPRAGWINVGIETKEIALKPVRCLWAHPAGREPLVVEYPSAPLSNELRVMGGIVGQIAYRTEHYAPVRLEVKIDGQPAAELEFPPGAPGERRRTLDTRALAGTRHRVQFEVSADNPDMRHFCFDAGIY
jgi:hypothetical protein